MMGNPVGDVLVLLRSIDNSLWYIFLTLVIISAQVTALIWFSGK